MGTTEAVLSEMTRRRQELYLKNVTQEESRWQLLQRVYDGEDENDLAQYLPSKVRDSQAYKRNRQGKNAARRAIQRIVGAVQAGTLQWSGDEKGFSDEQKGHLKAYGRFTGLLALRLALYGQAALLPWKPPENEALVSPLTGFLWPIYSDWDATKITRLLAFESVAMRDGTLYNVYEIEPGRIRVFGEVRTLTDYQRGRLIADTPVTSERLPVAHVILSRDGNMHPEGLLEAALPAHWDYRRKQLQRNIAYELTALPQRVASGVSEGADDFDPLSVIYLDDPASTITYPFPQHLDQLDKGIGIAERDVNEMLHSPNVSEGAGESGEARLVSLEEQVHWAAAVADCVADCFTQCAALEAEYGLLPDKPVEFTLAPKFTAQVVATRQQIQTDHEKGLISRYTALLLRQALGDDVPEVELEAAEEEFNTQRVPAESMPGEADDADTEDAE
jgi:hypothetical protein